VSFSIPAPKLNWRQGACIGVAGGD